MSTAKSKSKQMTLPLDQIVQQEAVTAAVNPSRVATITSLEKARLIRGRDRIIMRLEKSGLLNVKRSK